MMNIYRNTKAVEQYYDLCQKWYSWVYSDRSSLGMHYGFWDADTAKKKDALINQYREIARLLEPKKGDLILDAGCGVGGASLWLAAHTDADYVGITLSSVQLKMAQGYARKRGLEKRVRFDQKNYFLTGFADGTFDHLFGIESFCYAYPEPLDAFSEMHRVLKSGGKMVMSDVLLLYHPSSEYEKKLAYELRYGFKVSGWNTPEEIISALKECGFKNIQHLDRTQEIRKSVENIYRLSRLAAPLRVLRYVGIISDVEAEQLRAGNAQKKMYDIGLFGYGQFVAEK
ncbi:MAG: class I SAM-dependent methyltransferase [bacterium]|nr:class I SAM-dependent methyltransferase [bacterium]